MTTTMRAVRGGGLWADIDLVVQLREAGWTLELIGEKFGYTRERVRQVIARYEAEAGRPVSPPPRAPRETALARDARRRANTQARVEREREEFRASHIGQHFGAWAVMDLTRESEFSGEMTWRALCRCDCGVVSKVHLRNLTKGLSASCGSKGHGIKRGWYRRSAPSNVVHIPEEHP